MEQAVEQCRSQRAVVVEDLRPVLEGTVGGDHRRAALITLADPLEEHIGAELVDGQVAEFVDDEQRRLEQPGHLALDAAGGLSGGQRVDVIDGTGEERRLALEASGMGQGDRQVRLADTDAAEQDHIAVLRQEVQPKHLLQQRPVDLLWPTPIEAVERLDPRQAGRLHPAIVDPALWQGVHDILVIHCRNRGGATRSTVPFLLKGIVFGNDGRALSPWHSIKKASGRRHRYYIPMRDTKEHAGASGLPRFPAAELESAVLDHLRAILRAPALLGDLLTEAIELDPTLDEAKVTVAMTRIEAIWDQLFPAEQTRIVRLLVEKVIVSPDHLEVRLRANGIEQLALELRSDQTERCEEALA